MASYQEQIRNSPISITDLRKMYTQKIRPNEGRMTSMVITLNNEMVQRWYDDILVHICDSSSNVSSYRGEISWRVYLEGHRIRKFRELQSEFSIPTREVVDYWIDFLNRSTEELHSYGTRVLLQAYDTIVEYYRTWVSDQLYELVFKYSTPLEWQKAYEASAEAQKILLGEKKPYDIVQLAEKCQILINVQATPSS